MKKFWNTWILNIRVSLLVFLVWGWLFETDCLSAKDDFAVAAGVVVPLVLVYWVYKSIVREVKRYDTPKEG